MNNMMPFAKTPDVVPFPVIKCNGDLAETMLQENTEEFLGADKVKYVRHGILRWITQGEKAPFTMYVSENFIGKHGVKGVDSYLKERYPSLFIKV